MTTFLSLAAQLSWPFALALAWLAGEFGHRLTGLPRISFYGIVGFAMGNLPVEVLPRTDHSTFILLVNAAFGLMLFELGYRINLRWLRTNPWVPASGLFESALTFALVYLIATAYNTAPLMATLLGALSMATSPAGLLSVIHERNCSGQMTERVLHLSAFNCILALFVFKIIVGIGVFQTSGSLLHAAWSSLVVLAVSAGLGALFGVVVPAILRRLGNLARDATVAFAIAVILLVAVTNAFGFSPVLATLTFGMVARHRRITLSQAQRNFGVLGGVLAVVLFSYVASMLEWEQVVQGIALALPLIGVRFVAKTLGIGVFSRVSGITWRKGVLTGMAMTPISIFVILLLDQVRPLGIDLVDVLVPVAAMALILEVIGPIITQRALELANETQED